MVCGLENKVYLYIIESKTSIMKDRLLNGETIELINENEDLILVWLNERVTFCLELNGKVIKATKTFKPIQDKLKQLGELTESI